MKNVNLLLVVAAILIALWVVAGITQFLAGALLNLLLVVGVILLVMWGIRKLR
jgi:hypothetical protein